MITKASPAHLCNQTWDICERGGGERRSFYNTGILRKCGEEEATMSVSLRLVNLSRNVELCSALCFSRIELDDFIEVVVNEL